MFATFWLDRRLVEVEECVSVESYFVLATISCGAAGATALSCGCRCPVVVAPTVLVRAVHPYDVVVANPVIDCLCRCYASSCSGCNGLNANANLEALFMFLLDELNKAKRFSCLKTAWRMKSRFSIAINETSFKCFK